MLTIRVVGYKEAKAIIDELPNNMQKRMLLAALRMSAKPALDAAKRNVPVRSGDLKKQLKIVRFRDRQAPKSEVDVAVKSVFSRSSKKKAINEYYGKFVHEGTKDPRKSRKSNKPMVFIGKDGEKVFATRVKGLKLTPYLEQAYSQTSQRIVTEFGDNLAAAVEKFINKNFRASRVK